ncbi:MAG: hypothetical protein J6D10_06370 [Clostridia bacterium]|nr:hypothetical protein [Clostridia bacterium]
MNNEMYLIHSEDYISHINDKVRLYSMMKQLTHMIGKLPIKNSTDELIKLYTRYDELAEEMFRTWGIPKSYLIFGKMEDLSELMENELISPEDAGYVPCECCSCCGDEANIEDEDYEEDVDPNDELDAAVFAYMMETVSEILHNMFGDKVSIHIVVN